MAVSQRAGSRKSARDSDATGVLATKMFGFGAAPPKHTKSPAWLFAATLRGTRPRSISIGRFRCFGI